MLVDVVFVLRLKSPIHFSSYKLEIDTNLVEPITILTASIGIFSNSSASYLLQLVQTTSTYSKLRSLILKLGFSRLLLSKSN